MSRRIFAYLSIAVLGFAASAAAAPRIQRDGLVYDGIPAAPPDLADRVDAYMCGRQATVLGWSPGGQLLVTTRFGENRQLHLLDAAGGARRQLTFFGDPVTEAAFAPAMPHNAFVFRKDAGGDGRYQLFYQQLGDPTARRLTDGKSVNGNPVWSNSGREIAFSSTARDGSSADLDLLTPASAGTQRLLVAADGADWLPLDWSPDDRQLLAARTVSAAETHVYLIDVATGEKRELDASSAKTAITAARYGRDGQGVYLISDRGGEFAALRYVNIFTGKVSVLSAPTSGDIVELALSRDGHYLAYVDSNAGGDELHMADLRAHADLTPPHLPSPGLIGSLYFDADGKRLAFDFSAPNRPRDAYVWSVEDNRLQAWTMSEPGPIDPAKFITPRLTHFTTFDRVAGAARQLPLYVFEPAGPGPHPVLIVFHGGPDRAFRPGFDPWIQYVVTELGYAVLAPNLRGSSGYGKSFESLDDGRLRADTVKDIGALLVWLEGQRDLDAKRVVVSGRAYGGYLTLEALANYSDRLRGGVDLAGMTDLIDYLQNMSPNRQQWYRNEFGDEHDPDMRAYLRNISPLATADRITKPVLIVQGRNDPLVPAGEAEAMVGLLQSHGVRVWYLLASDEGHSLTRQRSREAYYAAFAQFLIGAR